jgi:periplasmic protein TonB
MSTHPVIEHKESAQKPVRGTLRLVEMRAPSEPFRQTTLFEDSLLETSGVERRRRTWAAVLSFVFQCFVLGLILIVPLMFTEALPKQQLLTLLVAPSAPPPPPPPAAPEPATRAVRVVSDITDGRLRAPGRIPRKIQMIREEEVPPAMSSGGIIGGVVGGIPGGQPGGVIGGIISSTSRLAAVPKLAVPAPPKRIRISQGITHGLLTHRVEPSYPALARQARIQGVVVLTAIIDKNGSIQNLQLVSGHPMLAPAAIEAVKQWLYKPFLLNGQPVEVETTVTVRFQLQM